MTDIGGATIAIRPNLREFYQELRAGVSAAASQMETELAAGAESGLAAGGAVGGAALEREVGAASTRAAATASTRLASLSGSLGTIGSTMTSSFTKPFLGITALLGGIGLKTAGAMEQSQISFTTLLGSADKATSTLKELRNFANVTPFTMAGVVKASQQLLGVNVAAKDLIPTLTALGDTAGALGMNQDQFSSMMLAYTQMLGKGKIQGQEVLQMVNSGFASFWKLMSSATGKTQAQLQDLMQKGALDTATYMPKLLAEMEKQFGGSMQKQSQTLLGKLSTLWDAFSTGLTQAMQPLMPKMKGEIDQLIAAMPGLTQAIVPLFQEMIPVITQVVTGVSKLVGWFNSWPDPVKKVAVGLALFGAAAGPIATTVSSITKLAGAIGKVWKVLSLIVGLMKGGKGLGLVSAAEKVVKPAGEEAIAAGKVVAARRAAKAASIVRGAELVRDGTIVADATTAAEAGAGLTALGTGAILVAAAGGGYVAGKALDDHLGWSKSLGQSSLLTDTLGKWWTEHVDGYQAPTQQPVTVHVGQVVANDPHAFVKGMQDMAARQAATRPRTNRS